MSWEVEFTDEFASWWETLDEHEQDSIDPRRSAIMLIGGNKTGDDHFYERMVPIADRIYDEHLLELEQAQEPENPTKRR